MRWQVLVLLVFLILGSAQRLQASEGLFIRALYPDPATGSEWIAIENAASASVSASGWSVRDGMGAVKTYSLTGVWQASEVQLLAQATTKVSLNNAGDWVEILLNNQLQMLTDIYEESEKGYVWLLTDKGWRDVSFDEWQRRFEQRDWSIPDDENRETQVLSTPSVQQTIKPSAHPTSKGSPAESQASPVQQRSPNKLPFVVPKLFVSVSTHSAEVVAEDVPEQTLPPIPDRSEEVKTWLGWKRRVWVASAWIFAAGVFCVSASLPKLIRCYNEYASCLVELDSS